MKAGYYVLIVYPACSIHSHDALNPHNPLERCMVVVFYGCDHEGSEWAVANLIPAWAGLNLGPRGPDPIPAPSLGLTLPPSLTYSVWHLWWEP